MDYDLDKDDTGIAKAPFYGGAAFIFLTLCIFTAVTLQEDGIVEHWHIASLLLGSGLIAILLFLPYLLEGIIEKIDLSNTNKDSDLASKAYLEIKEMRSELDALALKTDKVPTLVEKIVSEANQAGVDAPSGTILDKMDALESRLQEKLDQIEANSFSSPLLPEPEVTENHLESKLDQLLAQFDEIKNHLHTPQKISSPVSGEAISADDSANKLPEPELNTGEATNVDSEDLFQADDEPTEPEIDPDEHIETVNEPPQPVTDLELNQDTPQEEIPSMDLSGENDQTQPENPSMDDSAVIAAEDLESEQEDVAENATIETGDNLAEELDLGLPPPEETLRKVDALLSGKENISSDVPIEKEETANKNGTTTVVANVMIGIGNKPFLRGEGPGLSWEEGVSMNFVEIGKWAWSPPRKNASLTVQIYRNDQDPDKTGKVEVKPGQKIEITPDFS
jgi:hypothetical protein